MVPVDGSDTSKRGLNEAIKLAHLCGARLCLLNVIDTSIVNASIDTATNVEGLIDLLRRNGETILDEAAALAAKNGIKTDKKLEEAIEQRPAEVIVDQARRWRADLIVMGTHGRRGFKRMLLGSDAEGVARTASVPVLLVRATAKRGLQKPHRKTSSIKQRRVRAAGQR